ncbi:antitoxin VbhA family protein [Deinococcus hopiensis]|uniref:antitoxin VbhA family protein n=1 Tax=Deinococcus hopiensis TaxID=309885 RepID=UPI000A00DA85|nr:antitoxin VbhA family protein [Deinococcus hopiensis]
MASIQDQVQKRVQELTAQGEREQAERQKRAKVVKSVRRSIQIEGRDLSPATLALFDQFIEGKLTLAQVSDGINQHYLGSPGRALDSST